MGNSLVDKYDGLRGVISSNIDSISTLLRQVKEMEDLIEKLGPGADADAVKSLRDSASCLHETISVMFMQIRDLHTRSHDIVNSAKK